MEWMWCEAHSIVDIAAVEQLFKSSDFSSRLHINVMLSIAALWVIRWVTSSFAQC